MSRTSYLRRPLAALLLAAALAARVVMAAGVLASPAQAAEPIIVNYGPDEVGNDGHCTLREAIISANTNAASGTLDGECTAGSASGEDTINFSLGSSARIGVVTEASPYEGLGSLPPITDPAGLTIDGGSADITVMGDRVLVFDDVVAGAQLILKNLTVSHLPADVGGAGGSIVNHGTLEVINSTISNSFIGGSGGAISNSGGTVEVINSTISNNSAGSGGGISNNGGTVKVINSTLSGNRADFGSGGGGIYNNADGFVGAATVSNSTLSDNSADHGGGISNHGLLWLFGSTLSGNSAVEWGGGIGEGGGIYTPGTASVANTIVANNDAINHPLTENCSTNAPVPFLNIFDRGYNLEFGSNWPPGCGFSGDNNSLPDTDPLLDPDGLQDNGGPTKTIALQKGSPAIDAIPPGSNGCGTDITQDQRGVARPKDGNNDGTTSCDIGAFELEVVAQGALSINDTSVSEGNSGTTNATFKVSLSEQSTQQVTVDYATGDGTANAPADYQATSATLTFAPGTTTQTVSVPVKGDTLFEPDETFSVTLSNPTNATLSGEKGIGTITNDDPAPDKQPPTVKDTSPQADAKEVLRTTKVTANFSEAVQASTLTSANVQLFSGKSKKQVKATLSWNPTKDPTSVTLTPSVRLDANTTYRAVVGTGVKDLADNALDQDQVPNNGNQPKQWTFTTGSK